MSRTILAAAAIGWLLGTTGAVPVRAEGIPEPPVVLYGLVTDALGKRLTNGTLSIALPAPGGGSGVTLVTNLADINAQFSYIVVVPCETPVAGQSPRYGTLQLVPASPVSALFTSPKLNDQTALNTTPGMQATLNSRLARGTLIQVDLSTTPLVDSDVDGLVDDWERRYFGDLRFGPNDDPDGDGIPNLAEQRAGTDPTRTGEVTPPIVLVLAREGSRIRVLWNSVPGKSYLVLRSSQVHQNYTPTGTPIRAVSQVTIHEALISIDGPPAFFQIQQTD